MCPPRFKPEDRNDAVDSASISAAELRPGEPPAEGDT
jgi:hypothetical protein